MDHLKYPVGRFVYDKNSEDLQQWIETIRAFPSDLESILDTMTSHQLNSCYRPEGWTASQVVHHVSDSHSQALFRFKTALTEDNPTIKPYLEGAFAKLADYSFPLESAIHIIKGVHLKWTILLEHMDEAAFTKGYYHPESGRYFSLHHALALYAWHCRHHLGHVEICAGM